MTYYVKVTDYIRKDGQRTRARPEIRVETEDVEPGTIGIQVFSWNTGNEMTGQSLLDLNKATMLRDALTAAIKELKEQDRAKG